MEFICTGFRYILRDHSSSAAELWIVIRCCDLHFLDGIDRWVDELYATKSVGEVTNSIQNKLLGT